MTPAGPHKKSGVKYCRAEEVLMSELGVYASSKECKITTQKNAAFSLSCG